MIGSSPVLLPCESTSISPFGRLISYWPQIGTCGGGLVEDGALLEIGFVDVEFIVIEELVNFECHRNEIVPTIITTIIINPIIQLCFLFIIFLAMKYLLLSLCHIKQMKRLH